MRPRNGSVFPAAVFLLLACEGSDMPASDPGLSNPPVNASVSLTRLGADSIAFALYSGVATPGTMVIRDATAWSALWQNIHATTDPIPAPPEIDFSQEMIVAAALGTRNSGGYNVLLTRATEASGAVQIEVLEISPGADCFTTQALTQPIDLARTARRDGSIHFVVTRQVRPCGP